MVARALFCEWRRRGGTCTAWCCCSPKFMVGRVTTFWCVLFFLTQLRSIALSLFIMIYSLLTSLWKGSKCNAFMCFVVKTGIRFQRLQLYTLIAIQCWIKVNTQMIITCALCFAYKSMLWSRFVRSRGMTLADRSDLCEYENNVEIVSGLAQYGGWWLDWDA